MTPEGILQDMAACLEQSGAQVITVAGKDELDAYWSQDRYVRRLRVSGGGYYEEDGQRFYFPTTGIGLQESDRTAADGCMEKYEGGSGGFL